MDLLLCGRCFFGRKPISDKIKEEEKRFLEALVNIQDKDEPREMPPLRIVMFPDLVVKAWGWGRLLPISAGIEWSDYVKYLQAYHKNNAPEHNAGTNVATLVAMAKSCLEKENQLASMWKNQLESHADVILLRKYIMLSSLVKECADSVILKEGVTCGCDLTCDVFIAAFMCLEKEADLILELLRRGAHFDDELIEGSSEIRMCALCLIGHSDRLMDHSEIAASAMLGIAKETSTMCQWMHDNEKLLDILCSSLPDYILESDMIRCRTLLFMTSILTMPYTPAAGIKPVIEAGGTSGDDASDKLNRRDQEKTIVADFISKTRKRVEETKEISEGCREQDGGSRCLHVGLGEHGVPFQPADFLGEGFGLGHHGPMPSLGFRVKIQYRRCGQLSAQGLVWRKHGDSVGSSRWRVRSSADFCLKMEDYLLSQWRNWLASALDYVLPVNIITESSLIRDRAHSSLYATEEEFSIASAIAFLCIAMEADLMSELLRCGAKPTDDIIEQSSFIRLCALSLLNLKGDQSVLGATAMMTEYVAMAFEKERMANRI
ncbi:hypothetical protein QOZ80_2BG0181470 [Eleusine coracana subsp. coracana]|nr:hypothetical protein QOZ80_2BG0181470 [Eleusine coracana subsp. coracana]